MGKHNSSPSLGTACDLCELGKIAPGYTTCAECVSGTYASSEGSTQCDQCARGKFATASESCSDCAAGTFAGFEGAVFCTSCGGGKYSATNAWACSDCDQGLFSNPGSSSCETCDHTRGFISNGEGNNEYCGPGQKADQTAHDCVACEAGKYSIGGVDHCISCDHTEGSELSSCEFCGAGGGKAVAGTLAIPTCCLRVPRTRACLARRAVTPRLEPAAASPPPLGTTTTARSTSRVRPALLATTALLLFPTVRPAREYSAAGAAYCSTNGTGTRANADRSGTSSCPANTFSTGATTE